MLFWIPTGTLQPARDASIQPGGIFSNRVSNGSITNVSTKYLYIIRNNKIVK